MYHCISVAGFDAIFDWQLSMPGRFIYLHIVRSTPCNQSCKILSFMFFSLMFTSHFALLFFSPSSVNDVFAFHHMPLIFSKNYFKEISYNYAKITVLFVAYLYSLGIFINGHLPCHSHSRVFKIINIMITHLCNILQFFTGVKTAIFR